MAEIKTLEDAIKVWESERKAANDCIVEILESYMDFVDLMTMLINHAPKIDKHTKQHINKLLIQRKNDWQPILQHTKEHQNNGGKK